MVATVDRAPKSSAWELVITRAFDAPRPLVFEAWTDPARLARWWGPRGFRVPSCQMDVREGGAFRICMRSPDGTDHLLRGIYREVVPPERLAFTWAWEDAEGRPKHETMVRLDFTEQAGRTRLRMQQGLFESENDRDQHGYGWNGGLDCLEDYLRELASDGGEP